jgi:hypothetical protein
LSTEAAFADLAALLEELSAISGTRAKTARLASYLATLGPDDLRRACTFLGGSPFPIGDPRRLMLGWAAIGDVLRDLTHLSDDDLRITYLAHGDLGMLAADVLSRHPPSPPLFARPLTLRHVAEAFDVIAAFQGPSSRRAKTAALRALLVDASPLEPSI